MKEQKQVKIVGLSVLTDVGALRATELKFDANIKLYPVKGEVGAGKTTLNKVMRLATQGSDTLVDKNLYGGPINTVAQLLDGDRRIFVGCKSKEGGSLDYFLYEEDENGKKVKDPIIDGVKATPAAYLKSLQTALTWRLNELTSENPTVQRKLLLELYAKELEKKGVVFDKSSPFYVGGIIDQIEKAKNERSYKDMKRKEVGGIADDLKKKGIDLSERLFFESLKKIDEALIEAKTERQTALNNPKQAKEKKILELRNYGLELSQKIQNKAKEIDKFNEPIIKFNKDLEEFKTESINSLIAVEKEIQFLTKDENITFGFVEEIKKAMFTSDKKALKKQLEFKEGTNTCISKADDFSDPEIKDLLNSYLEVAVNYQKVSKEDTEDNVDTTVIDKKISDLEKQKLVKENYNKDVTAVNAYFDWTEQNAIVNDLNKEYFMLLSGIDTGVEGLQIAPEYDIDKDGQKIARGNDIYLMYDGAYDPEYFNNESKELRKLSAYSDTQKPMICLLIQKYLLSQKPKALPYLWIDQVPIDKKTKTLLDKMSEELGLWLFVNWTGDFDKENLQEGEILIENGQIFQHEK